MRLSTGDDEAVSRMLGISRPRRSRGASEGRVPCGPGETPNQAHPTTPYPTRVGSTHHMAGLPMAYSSSSHPSFFFTIFWSGLTLQPYKTVGNASTWACWVWAPPVIDVGLPAGDMDADPSAASSLSLHILSCRVHPIQAVTLTLTLTHTLPAPGATRLLARLADQREWLLT